MLLRADADVNVQDNNGETRLMKAARRSNFQTVRDLLDNGAEVNVRDHEGNTPLLHVTRYDFGEFELFPSRVELLLRAGAEINARDRYGMTALHHISVNS